MQAWLDDHKVAYDSDATKKELYVLCQVHKEPIRFELDEFVREETEHEVVRLPPYHSFYNPIEMIWSQAKRYYDAHVGRNNDFSLAQTDEIWAEALESAATGWRKCCELTEKRILQDYRREVSDDSEDSYQIHIICDEEDDEKDFDLTNVEILQFKEEDSAQESCFSTVTPTEFTKPSSVRRSLLDMFESQMEIGDSEDSELIEPSADLEPPLKMAKVEATILDVNDQGPVTSLPTQPDSSSQTVLYPSPETQSCFLLETPQFSLPDTPPSSSAETPPPSSTETPSSSSPESQLSSSTDVPPSLSLVETWLQRSDETVISNDGEVVRVTDLKRLLPGSWLNDVVINKYLSLLAKRSEGAVHVLNTFFYQNLLRSYDNVSRWTKKVDIFSKKMLLIPIHSGNHWCLCVVYVKEKSIQLYDSLAQTSTNHTQVMDTILSYLDNEHRHRKGQSLDSARWTTEQVNDIPHQNNDNDCGVFVCVYAEYLTRHASFLFTANDMPHIRRRMMEEIVSSELSCTSPMPSCGESQHLEQPITEPESTLIQDHRSFWMRKDKVIEISTKIDRVLLHESARFHQGDKRFPPERANCQCTANSICSIVALLLSDGKVTRDLLDRVLVDGDKYYADSVSHKDPGYTHLSPEDLLTSIIACGHSVTIEPRSETYGLFSSGTAVKDITVAINSMGDLHASSLEHTGFLYIADSKTVAFLISPVISESLRRVYYMFNPHSVDNSNCHPLSSRSRGVARLFRCLSTDALARLLVVDRRGGNRGAWQIYSIKITEFSK
ncbi:uncharacterized protein LOC107042917 [Diachasma alloeum]|nr:uncharacterized protein LOC107042917 [Diachasma alloeum]